MLATKTEAVATEAAEPVAEVKDPVPALELDSRGVKCEDVCDGTLLALDCLSDVGPKPRPDATKARLARCGMAQAGSEPPRDARHRISRSPAPSLVARRPPAGKSLAVHAIFSSAV